jgi:hypothetical protein
MKLEFSLQILKKVTHEEKKVGYSMLYASVDYAAAVKLAVCIGSVFSVAPCV